MAEEATEGSFPISSSGPSKVQFEKATVFKASVRSVKVIPEIRVGASSVPFAETVPVTVTSSFR